jgi:hypothetical protein
MIQMILAQSHAKGSAALNALAIALVVLAGGLCLAMPFWGDQALFTVYARQLTQGAVLYRDIFDVKQPGIFLFYLLGGSLFGFTEIGIHLFELMYWLAFSVFALITLRPYFSTRWAPPLVPAFTVVVYYSYAGLLDLTQIEILVGFPILVAWWLIDQADPGTHAGRKRYAAAGLLAAAIVLLKHLYLLIVVAFLGYAMLRSRRRGATIGDLQRCVLAFLVALAVPLLAVLVYFAAQGQLGRIWWAYFEVAPAQQLMGPRPIQFLIVGARRFMIGHAPILILAALGCIDGLRRRAQPQMALVVAMVLWGSVSSIAFFILQGWPVYKWALFTVPLGILAVVGVEALVGMAAGLRTGARMGVLATVTALAIVSVVIGAAAPERHTPLLVFVVIGVGAGIGTEVAARPWARAALLWVLSAALGVSAGLAAVLPTQKIRSLMQHDFALAADSRRDFQQSWNTAYRDADVDLARLYGGDVLPGPFYVFGDPVLLYCANRPQGASILGWGPEILDRREWQVLHAELQANLPPYIIVNEYSSSMIRSRYPALMGLFETKYRVAFVGASGTWYVRR